MLDFYLFSFIENAFRNSADENTQQKSRHKQRNGRDRRLIVAVGVESCARGCFQEGRGGVGSGRHDDLALRSAKGVATEALGGVADTRVVALSITVAVELADGLLEESSCHHRIGFSLGLVVVSGLDVALGASEAFGANAGLGGQENRLVDADAVGSALAATVGDHKIGGVALGGGGRSRFVVRDRLGFGVLDVDSPVFGLRGVARPLARVVLGVDLLLALKATKTPVAVAAAKVADTTGVAILGAREPDFESTVSPSEAKVAVALSKEALAVAVAVGGAALRNDTSLGGSAIVARVTFFAGAGVTQADTVLGATVSSLATLLAGLLEILLNDGCGFGDALAHVALLAAPSGDAVAGSINADTVGFTLLGTLDGFFAGRASETRRAEAFAAEAVTTGRLHHFVAHRHIGRLTRVGTGGVDLDSAVGATKTVQTEALAEVAHTTFAALVRAGRGFQSDGTAVGTFVASFAGTDASDANAVVIARARGARASLGLGAVRTLEAGEALALALDAHALRGFTFFAATRLAVLASGARLAEALVELAHTLSGTLVALAETNFDGAVSTLVAVQAEAAAVAAQTVLGAILGAGLVLNHLFALFAVKTGVADALAKVADTTEHAVVLANVLCLATLAREAKVAEAVAVLADTVLAHFAGAVVDGAIGARIAGGAVTLLRGAVADTSATALLAVDLGLGAHLHDAAVVTFVFEVAAALAVQHALAA